MQSKASHLSRSRHGIWYFRWRVPASVRARHPELPKELKRSTKTADTRRARAIARELYCEFLLRYAIGQNMSSFDSFRFSGFTVKRDPVTAVITEYSTDASDTPESLALLDKMVESDTARVVLAQQNGAAFEARKPAEPLKQAVGAPEPPTIGEAIERYSRFQLQNRKWTENTAKYTHLPSLRLFREMVGLPTEGTSSEAAPSIDLPLAQLTRQKLEAFIDEFWRFPDQQGMRNSQRSAREIFAAGGPAQSQANVYKRLGHIRQFLEYCCEKDYVDDRLLRELELVLKADTARSRQRAAEEAAGEDGVATDGYVKFTAEEIADIFGAKFVRHVGSNAARYWIPLLSRFTGLRVNEASQLRPVDIALVDGVHCVHVRGEVGKSPDKNKQRVKTVSARRVIPLHPKLLELGLLEYVRGRVAQGATWMWDDLLWTDKSGFGKYPSRDFQKLASAVGVYKPRRKVFHSFRSTISQELSHLGLEGELIDQLLGHASDSVRIVSYGRTDHGPATPVQRVFEVMARVQPGFDVPPWRATGVERVSSRTSSPRRSRPKDQARSAQRGRS